MFMLFPCSRCNRRFARDFLQAHLTVLFARVLWGYAALERDYLENWVPHNAHSLRQIRFTLTAFWKFEIIFLLTFHIICLFFKFCNFSPEFKRLKKPTWQVARVPNDHCTIHTARSKISPVFGPFQMKYIQEVAIKPVLFSIFLNIDCAL